MIRRVMGTAGWTQDTANEEHEKRIDEIHTKFEREGMRMSQSTRVVKGTVKWWNDAKGYGFVHTEERPGEDIFAHYTAILGDGYKTLEEGQQISFELVTGPKGPQAFNIVKKF
jgi:CspA family cold shock protein